MRILIILNEPPYGNERSYNGLRLAGSLARQSDTQLKVFLIGDAVSCAKAGQKVRQGFYNIQVMLGRSYVTQESLALAAVAWMRVASGMKN